MKRIRWDRVLVAVCLLWLGYAAIGAVRAAGRLETELAETRDRLNSTTAFAVGAMKQARLNERRMREMQRKLWLAEGRLPGVTE